MQYVKPDSELILLVSKDNLNAWIEVGLRSVGALKDTVTPVDLEIGVTNKTGLIPIKVKLKTEKKGVLIEH